MLRVGFSLAGLVTQRPSPRKLILHRGYLKLWRKTEDSGLLQMPETLALFSFLLIKATHKPRKIGTPHGVVNLEAGQYISGRLELASVLKMSERVVRTSLERLVKMEILTIKPTNRYSIYTIVKYAEYQESDQQTTSQTPTNDQLPTNWRPATDQLPTTKQTHKHINTEEINTLVTSGETQPKADRIPYEEIINLYHQKLPKNPKVALLTAKRKGQIGARWKSGVLPDLEAWSDYFTMVSDSPFLTGKIDPIEGKTRFVADIEWLTNETNFTKVWERKYHGR